MSNPEQQKPIETAGLAVDAGLAHLASVGPINLSKYWRRRFRVAAALAAAIALISMSLGAWAVVAQLKAAKALEDATTALAAENKARSADREARDAAVTALHDLLYDHLKNLMARAGHLSDEDKELLRKMQKQLTELWFIDGRDVESRTIRGWAGLLGCIISQLLGGQREALVCFRVVLDEYRELIDAFPARQEFRQNLAITQIRIGYLLTEMRRVEEGEAAYADALAIRKKLFIDYPNQPDMQNDLADAMVHLASYHNQQGNYSSAKALLDEANSHHQAVLKADSRRAEYRQTYFRNLHVLAIANAGLLDPSGAVRAAETLRGLGWDPPAYHYYAACAVAQCIPIVKDHTKLDAKKRAEALQFYSDQALAMLRDAVAKGYKDVAHMKKDTDLDPLRERDDFKKLLADLEGAKAPAPPAGK